MVGAILAILHQSVCCRHRPVRDITPPSGAGSDSLDDFAMLHYRVLPHGAFLQPALRPRPPPPHAVARTLACDKCGDAGIHLFRNGPSPSVVTDVLGEHLNSRGYQFHFEKSYSCEKNPTKQGFLQRIFGDSLTVLFDDAIDVAKGFALNVVPQVWEVVPGSIWLIAGFPCDDVSGLDPNHGNNGNVCEDGTARTGAVFSALLSILVTTASIKHPI